MMSITVWTKIRAIETMSASLGLPNVGWQQFYLLLCTIPTGWLPDQVGKELDAATLQSVAASRKKEEITDEQCQKLAAWSACSELWALWHVLKRELQEATAGGHFRAGASRGWLIVVGRLCVPILPPQQEEQGRPSVDSKRFE